jgi:hypothetical protein
MTSQLKAINTMKHLYSVLFAVLIAFVIACEDDSKFSIKPSLGFMQREGVVAQSESAGTRVRFYSNVPITEPVTVQVAINNVSGLVYGTDYTTDPAPVDNVITLTIDPEDEQPSFLFSPVETGAEEAKRIEFEIISVEGSGLKLAQAASRQYSLAITGFEEVILEEVIPVTLSFDFNTCSVDFATPAEFNEVFETAKTDRGWGCRAFGVGASRAPRASAFGGAAGEDRAWMILKNPIAIASGADVTIDFMTFSAFPGPGTVSVKWSSNYSGSGDPLAATWTTLSTLDSQFPVPDSKAWKNVTGSFTNISGTAVYIAFVWTGGTAAASTSYDIDDLTITVE